MTDASLTDPSSIEPGISTAQIADHELVYTHDRDMVDVKLVCHAPATALCRSAKRFDVLGEPIEDLVYPECIAVEWHENDPGLIVECQAAPQQTFPLARIPVTVGWDGEDWAWSHAGDPAAQERDGLLASFEARRKALGASCETPFEQQLYAALKALAPQSTAAPIATPPPTLDGETS